MPQNTTILRRGVQKVGTETQLTFMKKILLIALSLSLTGVLAFAADGEKKGTPKRENPRDKMLEKYDKNGDGKLDASEREAWRKDREAEVIKKYDKNGDGKLDQSEREAARAERRKTEEEAKPKDAK
jgi:Ca2+-binding EF-hand superfamily protein